MVIFTPVELFLATAVFIVSSNEEFYIVVFMKNLDNGLLRSVLTVNVAISNYCI